MATSNDLKEALTRRLKKMEESSHQIPRGPGGIPGINRVPSFGSSTSSLVLGNIGKPTLNSMPSSQIGISRLHTPSVARAPLGSLFEPTFTSAKVDSPVQVPVIQCEGFLSKFSSGSLTGRWQRRYFILENGRFGYYKKQPESRESTKPDKSFSLSKLKAVFTKEPTPPSEREFSIQLGDVVYQLKASTPSEMRKWCSALSIALAHKDSFQSTGDVDGESSAVDMVSVSNSISSVTSDGTLISEEIQAYIQQQRVQAAAAAKQHETVWEIDIDPDQLDGLFEEWYNVNDASIQSMKQYSDKLVEGLFKSLSHMLCTISGELYDPLVVDIPGHFFRAKSAVTAVKRSAFEKENAGPNRKGEDPVRLQLNAVFIEYVPRQINLLTRFLDLRNIRKFPPFEESVATSEQTITEDDWSGRHDLIPVINATALIMSSLSSLFIAGGAATKTAASDCLCCYCDPTGERLSGTLSAPDTCLASERWRKMLRACLQRICSELEIGLIEDIQADMYDIESTWEADAESGRGPKRDSHALFGNRTGIWMSAWSSHFIFLCEQKAVGIVKTTVVGGKCGVEYCKRLISEILASVLVAVFNSAWRNFKRESLRIGAYAQERKEILSKVALLQSQNTGFWSVFTAQQTQQQITEISKVPEEFRNTLSLAHLLSFSNECILLSTFLSESIEDNLPYIPKIFASCFEGLSVTFANTAIEICRQIVHFHYAEKVILDVDKAVQLIRAAPANIDLVRSTPMITCRDSVEKFINELIPLGAHPIIKGYCIPHLAASVMNIYTQSVLKSRIKLRSNKILLPVVSGDLIIFKSLFSEQRFHCKDTVMTRAVLPLTVVYGALSEKDAKLVLSEWGRRIAEVFGSRHGVVVAQLIVDIRGDFSKNDKATLIQLIDPSISNSTTASTAVSSMVSSSPFISAKERAVVNQTDDRECFPWRFY